MRSLVCLLLVCASTASAGTFPITTFEPDTAEARRRAQADTVSLPVWVGIQCAPVAGESGVVGQKGTWDTEGMPWLALSGAWPWTAPLEVWAAVGYERWRYYLRPEAVPFAPLLGLINPLKLDQVTVRTGFDVLIGRGHVVSGAFGPGMGLGIGWARVGEFPDSEWTVFAEPLVHALTYVQFAERARLGAGANGGFTYDIRHGGDPVWHWELEFRLETAVGALP
jgi:hypothetical protein